MMAGSRSANARQRLMVLVRDAFCNLINILMILTDSSAYLTNKFKLFFD